MLEVAVRTDTRVQVQSVLLEILRCIVAYTQTRSLELPPNTTEIERRTFPVSRCDVLEPQDVRLRKVGKNVVCSSVANHGVQYEERLEDDL